MEARRLAWHVIFRSHRFVVHEDGRDHVVEKAHVLFVFLRIPGVIFGIFLCIAPGTECLITCSGENNCHDAPVVGRFAHGQDDLLHSFSCIGIKLLQIVQDDPGVEESVDGVSAVIPARAFFKDDLPVNMDILIAGAILADVGKLLEYELDANGKSFQGKYGKYLRHPFSGVSLAEQCGVPAAVCHIIATHAGEGDMVKRTTEAFVVHHADFMTFEPFRDRLK